MAGDNTAPSECCTPSPSAPLKTVPKRKGISVSLAGAPTSTFFFFFFFFRDESVVGTNMKRVFVSTKHVLCRDKSFVGIKLIFVAQIFVATNVLSQQANFFLLLLFFFFLCPPHLPSPKNSVAQSSSLKIAQLVSQCCSRGQIGCNTATVPASVHFIVACVVYYLNDPVSASCEVFLVSSVVASRLATAFLTGN